MERTISLENGDGDDEKVDDRSSGNLSDAPADLMSSTGMLPSKSRAATTVIDSDGDDEEYYTGTNATGLMIASDDDDDGDGDDGDDSGAASSSTTASGSHLNGRVTRTHTSTVVTASTPMLTPSSCGAPSLNEAADAAAIVGVSGSGSGSGSADATPDESGGGGVRVVVLDSAALSSSAAALLEQMGDDPQMGMVDGFGLPKINTAAAAAAAGATWGIGTGEDDEEEEEDVNEEQEATNSAAPPLTTTQPLQLDGAGGGRSGQLDPEQAAAACGRVMALIASAADRLVAGPQEQATAAAPSDDGAATAAGVAAPVAVAGGEMDYDLADACRLVRELSQAGQAAPLQDPGAGCVAALMRIGATSNATDLDRAAAFAMVSELVGPRGPYNAPRALLEAVAADTAGLRALVDCLGRWGATAAGTGTGATAAAATTPLAAAALRAVVALSSAAAPLAALLRVRLLAALAAVLARGVSAARVQVSAAAFLAGLSSYSALGKLMLAAGIHVLASRLVGIRSRPLAVRESCCDIIANLSLGPAGRGTAGAAAADREAQAALTSAGAGPGLTKMLSLRNVQALCRTSDAIANLSLGVYVPAQNALRGAIAPLAGLLVGSVGQAGQPLLLAVKAARALGNACQNHPPNQDTAIKANVMPVLVAWMQSRVGPLVRAAAATAANLVVGNSDATDAAVASGILSPVLVLLMQPVAPPAQQP
ncbi:hypothetical protein VaNZ11_003043, partial [Volvox africanus]